MIKTIAFDADDTLWHNEIYFRQTETRLFKLLEEYGTESQINNILLEIEKKNVPLYGYGSKSFILSVIEAIGQITNRAADYPLIEKAINICTEQLTKPVELLDGVEDIIKQLAKTNRYRMLILTKGDLLEQERKLQLSGLMPFFDHIEIMSDKKIADYEEVLRKTNIQTDEFLMVGNSMKSDILPVIELGGNAVFIPYHTTWELEKAEKIDSPQLHEIESIKKMNTIIDF